MNAAVDPTRHATLRSVVSATALRWPVMACTVARLPTADGQGVRQARVNVSYGRLSRKTGFWGARFWEKDGRFHIVLVSATPLGSTEDAFRLLHGRSDLVIGLGCH